MKNRTPNTISTAVVLLSILATSALAAPPQVIKTIPDNGDMAVDPGLSEIVIVFDQDMSRGGHSLCGGGPAFPEANGKARWSDKRMFVFPVKLERNHDYGFSVNCQSFKNFRNLKAQSAEPYPLKFKTSHAPKKSNPSKKSPRILYQEAQYAEQTEGDLDKAINLYGQVIDNITQIQRLAAQATYQLGICYLKKNDKTKAAQYFQNVVSNYPTQKKTAQEAAKQLKKIQPEKIESVFEQVDDQGIRFISQKYGQIAAQAGQQSLLANCHIYYVDTNFTLYKGGMGAYFNFSGKTITEKVRLSGTSIPNQTHYDVMGQKLKTEIVPAKNKSSHWNIYWTPNEPLAPGESLYYGWSINNTQQLPQMPGGSHDLTMRNTFGSPAFETFFLVVQKNGLTISQSNPPTGTKELLNFNIYWWTKTVKKSESHVERIELIKFDLAMSVEKAITTISGCADGDPKAKAAIDELNTLDESAVLTELKKYFISENNEIRRSAIYVIYKGEFENIAAVVPDLEKLCSHDEGLTRGMAGLALGTNKVLASFPVLKKMTLDDSSGYARRCGAYALGLLGDSKAKPILKKATKDPDEMVQSNAKAALKMLNPKTSTIKAEGHLPENSSKANMTQSMHNTIDANGLIYFKSPNRLTNHDTKPITTTKFMNSDILSLTKVYDKNATAIPFATMRKGSQYHYEIKFNRPILPGESKVYYTEGTIRELIKPVPGSEGVFRFYMQHSPAADEPVLRLETYLLPENATFISSETPELQQTQKEGRIELRVKKIIPANGSITTEFQYRLPGAK